MSEMPERNVRGGEFTEKRAEREEDTPFVGFFSPYTHQLFLKGKTLLIFDNFLHGSLENQGWKISKNIFEIISERKFNGGFFPLETAVHKVHAI